MQRIFDLIEPDRHHTSNKSDNEQIHNFASDVASGLSSPSKNLPSKYFYDLRGSELFNKITRLDEYYLARVEKQILLECSKLLTKLLPKLSEIIELGCGDGTKTEIILREFYRQNQRFCFSPVDISNLAIDSTLKRITENFPTLICKGFEGDYFSYLTLAKNKNSESSHSSRLILFLGSNIGNYSPSESLYFLDQIFQFMCDDDYLLIGFDLKKPIHIMMEAYNDKLGITSEFNYNLLERINRELGGNFDRKNFIHYETYNPQIGAMQSFLVSLKSQKVFIESLGESFDFDSYEPIHTENSFKYSLRNIEQLAHRARFKIEANFLDHQRFFANSLWKKGVCCESNLK